MGEESIQASSLIEIDDDEGAMDGWMDSQASLALVIIIVLAIMIIIPYAAYLIQPSERDL